MRIGADTIRMEAINMVAVAVPIPMYNYLISRSRRAIGFKLDKIWLILFLHWSQRDAFFIMGKMFGSLETSVFYSVWVFGSWSFSLSVLLGYACVTPSHSRTNRFHGCRSDADVLFVARHQSKFHTPSTSTLLKY